MIIVLQVKVCKTNLNEAILMVFLLSNLFLNCWSIRAHLKFILESNVHYTPGLISFATSGFKLLNLTPFLPHHYLQCLRPTIRIPKGTWLSLWPDFPNFGQKLWESFAFYICKNLIKILKILQFATNHCLYWYVFGILNSSNKGKKTLLNLWTNFSNSGHSALDESTVRQLSSVAKRTLLVESFAKTWTFLCQEIHPIRRKHAWGWCIQFI